jgi:hypothetical protein
LQDKLLGGLLGGLLSGLHNGLHNRVGSWLHNGLHNRVGSWLGNWLLASLLLLQSRLCRLVHCNCCSRLAKILLRSCSCPVGFFLLNRLLHDWLRDWLRDWRRWRR